MRWAERILKRDKVCVCGSPATEAHHIYPKAKWPELRLDPNNGIGLCKPCHEAIYGKEEDAIEAFLYARPQQAKVIGKKLPSIMRGRGTKIGLELKR